MTRRLIVYTMIASFFALGVIDLRAGNYRTGVAGMLLGIVQALIFYEGS